MHYLYFVRVNKKDAKKPVEACKKARTILDGQNFASDSNGFWGSSKADWFVVGGRWSGELSKFNPKVAKARKYIQRVWPGGWEKTNNFYSSLKDELADPKSEVAQAQAYHLKVTGLPFYRDSYIFNGYDDDAVVITTKLIKELKKYKDTEVFDGVEWDEYMASRLPKQAVGDWLVIIDYHN